MSDMTVPAPINDGSGLQPRLRLDLNLVTLWGLPDDSIVPRGDALPAGLRAAGFEAAQSDDAARAARLGLRAVGQGRIDRPMDADRLARENAAAGCDATTVHAGTGLESDAEMDRLAAALLEASARHGHPIYLETHRATMTQDIRRTLDLVERFPELRFNLDFSHWYTGHEFTYGDPDAKLRRIAPVLERVLYLHGRIGDSCCMQVDHEGREDEPAVAHFRTAWTRAFAGFLRNAGAGDVVGFAPELLPARARLGDRAFRFDYARLVRDGVGGMREEGDRWTEALRLCRIAQECFEAAAALAARPEEKAA